MGWLRSILPFERDPNREAIYSSSYGIFAAPVAGRSILNTSTGRPILSAVFEEKMRKAWDSTKLNPRSLLLPPLRAAAENQWNKVRPTAGGAGGLVESPLKIKVF
jgi:hypothetical protein